MTLPSIGFGTSPYKPGAAPIDVEQPVRIALQAGYRLFDLAEAYGNEVAIGRALRSADAPPRSELHLVGKVWRTNFAPQLLRRACEDSLGRLGVERFALYLLHAPDAWRHVAPLEDASKIGWDDLLRRATPRDENGSIITDDVPLSETWEAMRGLVSAGLTEQIGVSNFTMEQIQLLGPYGPAANEIACWPLDASVLNWHLQQNIIPIGYSPLKRDILESDSVRQIASAHQRTPAQVILRWLIQTGIRPLTSSANPEHIRENLGALDFELTADELPQ
jgi:diketogulonate reductase-like aldo/keto reductase